MSSPNWSSPSAGCLGAARGNDATPATSSASASSADATSAADSSASDSTPPQQRRYRGREALRQAFATLRQTENPGGSDDVPSVSAPLDGIQRVYEKKGIYLNGFNAEDADWAIDSDVGVNGRGRYESGGNDGLDADDDDGEWGDDDWGVSDVSDDVDERDDRPPRPSARYAVNIM